MIDQSSAPTENRQWGLHAGEILWYSAEHILEMLEKQGHVQRKDEK